MRKVKTPENTCSKLDWIHEKNYNCAEQYVRHTAALWRVAAVRGATVAWSSVLFKAFSRLMWGPESVSLLRLCGLSSAVSSHAAAKNRSHALLPRSSSTETCELIWKSVCQRERWESNREPVSWPFHHFILLRSGSHIFPRGLKPCRGNCLWGIFDWFKEREGVFSGLGLKVRWRIEVSGRLSCVSMHVQMNTCDL